MRVSFAQRLTLGFLLTVLATVIFTVAALVPHRQNPFLPDVERHLAVAVAAALVLALCLAFYTARRLSRPLIDITKIVDAIGQGNYEPPRLWERDDFYRLAQGIAEMGTKIGQKVGELRMEQTQLRAILSALIESIIALDHEGRILFVNPAAERLFGVDSITLRGRPFLEGLRNTTLNEIFHNTLNQRTALSREITLHLDEERTLMIQTMPVDYGEQRSGVVAALHDITELRRLERVRQEFVANASHELKTPLTAIKGFVETLLNGALEDPENNRAFLETVQEHTLHLIRLIEDLLDLSAIEAKRVSFRLEPIALHEVAERILQGLSPMARARQVKVALLFPPDLPLARADREKVAQIFMNLLDNAIKFNKENGEVVVEALTEGPHIRVAVRDTGFGILPTDLSRVFERFYRGDKSHSHDIAGTGLGLAIVKHLVEAQGGTVFAESRPGEGSTFTFTLPRN